MQEAQLASHNNVEYLIEIPEIILKKFLGEFEITGKVILKIKNSTFTTNLT